ncbi:MAG: type II toxin-antitoxin system VapC family toxin [Chloroflexi bacterium]|nr:type II toxin-antitoxin system VapC family toxin [Chloroflexota bacterium]
MPYVTDAHPLIWHFTQDPRLSPKALGIFRSSAAGREIIIVPTIVLGEILHVSEAGRTPVSFQDVLSRIEKGDNYEIAALGLDVLKAASEIQVGLEMHDRFITATAKVLGLPLITKDKEITAAGIVEVVW